MLASPLRKNTHTLGMSLVVTKPPRPPRASRTTFGSRSVYTLHSTPNNVFAWRLSDERLKTATVAFKRQEDAVLMASMIERHVMTRKEWPDVLIAENAFKIFSGPPGEKFASQLVYIQSWQVDNLKAFCAHSYLDMVMLDTIRKAEDGYNLRGEMVLLSMPLDFYVHRLEEIYDSNAHDDEE